MHHIKRKGIQLIYKYKWWSFLVILFFFFLLSFIMDIVIKYMSHGIFLLDYNVYSGVVLSFFGCLIGVFVLERLSLSEAVNLNQFFELVIELLREAKASDKIIFLLPTFYIGGSEYNKRHDDFKDLLCARAECGVALEMNVLSHNFELDRKYGNESSEYEQNKLIYSQEFEADPLIKFHSEIYQRTAKKGRVEMATYYKGLFEFSESLRSRRVTINKLKKEYDNVKIIGIINCGQSKAILGAYTIENGILTTAQLIDNKEAAKATADLINRLIEEYKEA